MRGVIVVPRRSGVDEWRDRAWTWTHPWWTQHGYDVFEVEQDDDRPFNRAWCINEGARRAWPWDVLMIVDSDTVEDQDQQVHQAMQTAYDTGNFTVAHVSGKDLTREASDWIFQGKKFDWNQHLDGVRAVCDSRVNVVRADLFTELGGYDERFQGWGHEDYAFTRAMQTIRQFERIPGNSWHFWHANALHTAQKTKEWADGKMLARRYIREQQFGNYTGIRAILDERKPSIVWTPPDKKVLEVDLYVLTAGRGEFLEQTLNSFDAMHRGKVATRTIIDDSGDPAFAKWLDARYPRYRILHHDANMGFTFSCTHGWEDMASRKGAPYVFWLEEDFTFDRPFLLSDMAVVLDERPNLSQIALLRGPYSRIEQMAGSIPNQMPKSYTRLTTHGIKYMEHILFHTTNPHLLRREIASIGWPMLQHSEQRVTNKLVGLGYKMAFMDWGNSWCSHIGSYRKGKGY